MRRRNEGGGGGGGGGQALAAVEVLQRLVQGCLKLFVGVLGGRQSI